MKRDSSICLYYIRVLELVYLDHVGGAANRRSAKDEDHDVIAFDQFFSTQNAQATLQHLTDARVVWSAKRPDSPKKTELVVNTLGRSYSDDGALRSKMAHEPGCEARFGEDDDIACVELMGSSAGGLCRGSRY